MAMFLNLAATALYTVFIQNLVFSGGFGADEALRVAAKPKRVAMFAVMITAFSVVSSTACRALDLIPQINALSYIAHAAIYAGVLSLVFAFVSILLSLVVKISKKFLSTLGMAALNSLVFAVPFINRQMNYTLIESIGAGIGAGLAFALASVLIGIGVTKLNHNEHIPAPFRGTPAMFIYVSLLSLAFTGLSGGTVFA